MVTTTAEKVKKSNLTVTAFQAMLIKRIEYLMNPRCSLNFAVSKTGVDIAVSLDNSKVVGMEKARTLKLATYIEGDALDNPQAVETLVNEMAKAMVVGLFPKATVKKRNTITPLNNRKSNQYGKGRS